MEDCTKVAGMDVHKKTIVEAVLSAGTNRVEEKLTLENHPCQVESMVKRLSGKGPVKFVYEAGPCGYEIQRQITALGHKCAVIAPGLTPVKPGERVKTDRRDAEKLARLYRAGELTEVRVPTREEEAARDLVRIREDAVSDRLRARHRLTKLLLRQGRMYRDGNAWTQAHYRWLSAQRFEQEAQQQTLEGYSRALAEAEARLETLEQQVMDLAQTDRYRKLVNDLRCLKGVETLSAMTFAVEAQDFGRFGKARDFMGYTGAVSSENSSGERVRRGRITKTGNAHLRRVLIESAWSYWGRNISSNAVAARRKGCAPEIVKLARKAQDRLHRKFQRMVARGKPAQVAAVAVARELSGFVWAIAQASK